MEKAVYKKCGSPDIDEDDLHQEASIAFLNAIDTYNSEAGFAFTTYAGNCIKNHIINYLKKQNCENQKKFPVLTYEIDYDEVAGIRIKLNPVESDKIKSEPIYENDYHLTPEELFFRNHKKSVIYTALDELFARQRQYINYRFGLDNLTDYHTRESTAAHFGITIDEALKTEKEALSQLRKRLIPEFAYIVNDKPERITAEETGEYIPDRNFVAVYFELNKENNASTECEYCFEIRDWESEEIGNLEIDFECKEYNSEIQNSSVDKLTSALFYIYEDHGPLKNGVIILPATDSE